MKIDASKEAFLMVSGLIAIALFINGSQSALNQSPNFLSSGVPIRRDISPSSPTIAPKELVIKKAQIILTDQWSDIIDLRYGNGLYGFRTLIVSGIGIPYKVRDPASPNDILEIDPSQNYTLPPYMSRLQYCLSGDAHGHQVVMDYTIYK